MEFNAGSINADSGMSKYIYQEIKANLSAAFAGGPSPEVLVGWKKLSYCIAKGVIQHIKTDTGIRGMNSVTSGSTKKLEVHFTDGTSRIL